MTAKERCYNLRISQEQMSVAGILVVGDINIDLLASLDAPIEPGGDNLACELVESCGGVGANTALALARWGVPARLLGCVGRDWFGRRALDFLRAGGVDVSFVQQTDRAPTGLMFIAIAPGGRPAGAGQRTIFGSRGANARLGGQVLAVDWGCLEGVAAVHLLGYIFLSAPSGDAALHLFEEARKRNLRVSLDVGMAPSRQVSEKILEVARMVDVLFVGREEAFGLYRTRDLASVLAALQECGAGEIGVKLGGEGCMVYDGKGWREVPAFRVEARDTTGAGDAFAAAYLRARLRGWSQPEAALVANAAGAAATTVMGAAASMPAPEQVLRLLETSPLEAGESVRGHLIERLRSELRLAAAAPNT